MSDRQVDRRVQDKQRENDQMYIKKMTDGMFPKPDPKPDPEFDPDCDRFAQV